MDGNSFMDPGKLGLTEFLGVPNLEHHADPVI
jgi:hypothetical protein